MYTPSKLSTMIHDSARTHSRLFAFIGRDWNAPRAGDVCSFLRVNAFYLLFTVPLTIYASILIILAGIPAIVNTLYVVYHCIVDLNIVTLFDHFGDILDMQAIGTVSFSFHIVEYSAGLLFEPETAAHTIATMIPLLVMALGVIAAMLASVFFVVAILLVPPIVVGVMAVGALSNMHQSYADRKPPSTKTSFIKAMKNRYIHKFCTPVEYND